MGTVNGVVSIQTGRLVVKHLTRTIEAITVDYKVSNPHHAGIAYKIDPMVVARATRWSFAF